MIEISHLPFSASSLALQAEDSSSSFPEFIKNEVVQGKVLKTTSLENVLLIKGRRVMAKSHLPLKEGAVLQLKVAEAHPVPILKLLGAQTTGTDAVNVAMIFSAMKENLWKLLVENLKLHGVSKEDALLFKELLHDLSARLFKKPTPDMLRTFIEESGLGWEKKLKELCIQKQVGAEDLNKLIGKDLKGLGSRMLFQNAEKQVLLNRFVSALKNIQLLNHFSLEQDNKIFLPIPIQFPDGLFTIGQLLIHMQQQEKDKHGNKKRDRSFYRVSFLLEFSNLGPLRADLTIREKEIDGRFLLSKEEGKLLIERNLPSLISNLTARGFCINHMECHLKKAETIKHSLLKEIIPEEGCSVCLVA